MIDYAVTYEMTQRLSAAFVEVLERWLSTAEFKELCTKTRDEWGDTTCHSHDYCDANMAMLEAFCNVFGVKEDDVELNDAIDLMNAAWDMAKLVFKERAPTPYMGSINPGFCCAQCGAGLDFGCSCSD